MPSILDNQSLFGVQPLTAAVNKIVPPPTQIRALNLFKPEFLTTTYVTVEEADGQISLVQARPRGTEGDSPSPRTRTARVFKIPHLPQNALVLADDVQNVRAFGGTAAETVKEKVNAKLADCKSRSVLTVEHLNLGALKGQILNADGSIIYDIYDEFGLTRQNKTIALSDSTANVGKALDEIKSELRKKLKGLATTGAWTVLCGGDFIRALKYHESMVRIYEKWKEAAIYRDGDINPVEFVHGGMKFIEYDHDFGAGKANIAANQAILLPSADIFRTFYAPADMNETVNTSALPYYATIEKLKHDRGHDIRIQTNPLPMVLRPELVCTLTAD